MSYLHSLLKLSLDPNQLSQFIQFSYHVFERSLSQVLDQIQFHNITFTVKHKLTRKWYYSRSVSVINVKYLRILCEYTLCYSMRMWILKTKNSIKLLGPVLEYWKICRYCSAQKTGTFKTSDLLLICLCNSWNNEGLSYSLVRPHKVTCCIVPKHGQK